MISVLVWLVVLLAATAAYVVAPGLGVLLAIIGTVAAVVVGSRIQDRRWAERQRAERLRSSAARRP